MNRAPSAPKPKAKPNENTKPDTSESSAIGPDGEMMEFPGYDGTEPPKECKKPFTHFCVHTRKSVKETLDPSERKDKAKVNAILKERWLALQDDEKSTWRSWAEWDKKRYERDLAIYSKASESGGGKRKSKDVEPMKDNLHVPKKKAKKS